MIYEAIDLWSSSDPYLEHYGVKGMKWGVRKDLYKDSIRSAKQIRNQARRDANIAYSKASNFSNLHPITSNFKRFKNYDKSQKLWDDAMNKTFAEGVASNNYKKAKLEYKKSKIDEKLSKIDKKISKLDYQNSKWSKNEGLYEQNIKDAGDKISDFGKKSVQFIKDHKKEIAIGAAVVGGVALAYGAYKVHSIRQSNMAVVGKYISDQGIKLGDNITNSFTAPTSSKIPYRTISRRRATLSKGILGPKLVDYKRTWHSMPATNVDDFGNVSLSNVKRHSWITGDVNVVGGSKYSSPLRVFSNNKGEARRRRRAAIRTYKAIAKGYK